MLRIAGGRQTLPLLIMRPAKRTPEKGVPLSTMAEAVRCTISSITCAAPASDFRARAPPPFCGSKHEQWELHGCWLDEQWSDLSLNLWRDHRCWGVGSHSPGVRPCVPFPHCFVILRNHPGVKQCHSCMSLQEKLPQGTLPGCVLKWSIRMGQRRDAVRRLPPGLKPALRSSRHLPGQRRTLPLHRGTPQRLPRSLYFMTAKVTSLPHKLNLTPQNVRSLSLWPGPPVYRKQA